MKITDSKNSMRRILRVVEVCIILHNLLIDYDDTVPEHWTQDMAQHEQLIAAALGQEEYVQPIPDLAPQDVRRHRVINYFKDFDIMPN